MDPVLYLYNQAPDNEDLKDIILFVDTKTTGRNRHVFLGWYNGLVTKRPTYQALHLVGTPGNYNFYPQTVVSMTNESVNYKKQYTFVAKSTRTDRDRLIKVAQNVQYDRMSATENCQDWMITLIENSSIESDVIASSGIQRYV